MKRFFTFLLIFLGMGLNLKAQDFDYNKLSKEVQQKMDQNKLEGKDLFSGINTFYEIQFNGMEVPEKREKFKSMLPSQLKVAHISFDATKKSVRVEMKGNVPPEKFKKALGEKASKVTILTEQNFVLAN